MKTYRATVLVQKRETVFVAAHNKKEATAIARENVKYRDGVDWADVINVTKVEEVK